MNRTVGFWHLIHTVNIRNISEISKFSRLFLLLLSASLTLFAGFTPKRFAATCFRQGERGEGELSKLVDKVMNRQIR